MKSSQLVSTIQKTGHYVKAPVNPERMQQNGYKPAKPALGLVYNLCQALSEQDITYCHWKSNNALDRSASGENDLDLLVSRSDEPRFIEVLSRLGFKQAKASQVKQLPGVLDYFGYDEAEGRFIHVHAHYQLILGHDMSKNYRLPIERPYLESAQQEGLFKVPAPEFEYIVLVIRLILKHSTWEVILGGEGNLNAAERNELSYLHNRINQERLQEILNQHLPHINVGLFNRCLQALEPASSTWTRIKTAQQLLTGLRSNARRLQLVDTLLKLRRRVYWGIYRRIFKSPFKYRLGSGGAMIAIVGGDGAGKTTAIEGLHGWLAKYYVTKRVHLGKPAWSWTTKAVRAILKIGNLLGLYPLEASFRETPGQRSLVSPGYPWLIREVCRARDRYHTYLKVRRFANNGGLVLLDRYPVSKIQLMDGALASQFVDQLKHGQQDRQWLRPHPNKRLTRALINLEQRYYKHFISPELLVVIRVHPEIAVKRKTDEDADSVRERSQSIWELDWEDTAANVIDGGKSKAEVLTDIKSLIWSKL